MSFKIRFGLPARSDLTTISGVVATEQILNPVFDVGRNGTTGPTGSSGQSITGPTGPSGGGGTGTFTNDPIFNNVLILGSLTGNNGVFGTLTTDNFRANNITGTKIFANNLFVDRNITTESLNSQYLLTNTITGVKGDISIFSSLSSNIDSLTGDNSTFRNSNISYLSTNSITGSLGSFSTITTNNITSSNGSYIQLNVQNLTGNNGYFNNFSSNNVSIEDAIIPNLNVTNFTGSNAGINFLSSNWISTQNITGSNATFDNLNISSFSGSNGTFNKLITNYITGSNSNFDVSQTNTSNIVKLNVNSITGNTANISQLISSSISSNVVNSSEGNFSYLRASSTGNQIYFGTGSKITTFNVTQPPSNITVNFPARNSSVSVGAANTIYVEKLGSDIYGTRGGFPFQTISAALLVAQPGDTVLVSSGTYNENLIIPDFVILYGQSTQSCILQTSVSADTNAIIMGEGSRVENFTVILNSSVNDIILTGVFFPGTTSSTSKLRSCVINVENTTTATATVYGIKSSSLILPDPQFQAIRSSSVSAKALNSTNGEIRAVMVLAGGISARDFNGVAIGGAGANAIGVETVSSSSVFLCRNGLISGTTQDILQIDGLVSLTFSNISDTEAIQANGNNSVLVSDGNIYATKSLFCGESVQTSGTGYFNTIATTSITGTEGTFYNILTNDIKSSSGTFIDISSRNISVSNSNAQYILSESLTGGTGSFQNLSVDNNITGNSSNFNSSIIVNANISNITGTSASIKNITSTSVSSSTGAFTTLITNSITGGYLSFQTLTGGSGTIGNLSSTNISVSNTTGNTAFYSRLTAVSVTGSNASFGIGNFQVLNTNALISNSIVGSVTGNSGYFNSMTVRDITIENSTVNISNINNSNINALTGNSGSFNYLTAGSIISSTINTENLSTKNLTFESVTGISGDITNLKTRFIVIDSLTGISGSFNNLYSQTIQADNTNITNLKVNNISGSISIFDTSILSSLSSISGNISSLTSTNIYTSNISGVSGSFNNLSATNYTGSNLSTSRISFITGSYSASFVSSTGMSGSYTMTLPPNIPNYPISFLSTDPSGKLIWSQDIFPDNNTKFVSKHPIAGQFPTLSAAIQDCSSSIPPPSETNQFIIIVLAGTYTETLITVPSFIRIVGQNQEATIIKADGDHDIIHITENTSLNFMTLYGSSRAGVVVNDGGNFAILHKVSIESCNKGVVVNATNIPSQVYLEYCDIDNCIENDIIVTDSVFENFLSLENTFVFHDLSPNTTPTIYVGQNGYLTFESGALYGNNNSTGVAIFNSGNCKSIINSVTISNYNIGIASTGVDPVTVTCNSTIMSDNETDLLIGPDTSGYFFGVIDRSHTNISELSPFYIYGKDSNIINVSKKGGDFSSISAAIMSITGANMFNPYVVLVGPGWYNEPQILMKPFVSIIGVSSSQATIISTQNNEEDFIIATHDSLLKNTNLFGPTGSGYSTILYNGSSSSKNPFAIQNCGFGNGNIHISQNNNSGSSYIVCTDVTIPSTSVFQKMMTVSSTTGSYVSSFVCNNVLCVSNPLINTIFDISGYNTIGQINNSRISGGTTSTGTAVTLYNGSNVDMTALRIRNYQRAVNVPNAGTGPNININASFFDDCPVSVQIDNPFTTGFINGSIDREKIIMNSDNVSVQISYEDGNTISGNLFFGPEFQKVTNYTYSLQYSTNLGIINGGIMTPTGANNIIVDSGYGYTTVDNIPRFITWSKQTVPVQFNNINNIYVDNSGTVISSLTEPDFLTTIRIGNAYVGNSDILYTQDTSDTAEYTSSRINEFLTNAIGPIVSSGLIATSPTGLQLDVTSGEYYFSTHIHTLPQSTGINMTTFYRNGTGGYIQGYTGFVSAQWDNNSGTLQTLSNGEYVKHSLYVTDNGGTGTPAYLLVYGQQVFNSQASAINGPLPISPSFIIDDVFTISGVVVVKDNILGDHITDSVDIRPTISFRSGTTTATSDHNSLSNLTVGDAHPQYFRTDGTRTMAGNINMGNNNIINLNNVVSTAGTGMSTFFHASRHLPNGQDPLPTDTPISISISNNQGIANSFARSDHQHAHGNIPGGSTHSVADQTTAGFMSATDKIKLDSATGVANPNSIMYRDSAGLTAVTSITGSSLFFTNATIRSITGSTGTFTNLITTNITGSVSNFTTSIVNTITGSTSSFQNGIFKTITSSTGIFDDIFSNNITSNMSNFQTISTGNIQSTSGTFSNIDTQYINCQTGNFNIINVSSISGTNASFNTLNSLILGASGFTGDSGTFRNIYVTNNITGDSITVNNIIVKNSITGNIGTFYNMAIISGITGGYITNNSVSSQYISAITGSFAVIKTNSLIVDSTGYMGSLGITGSSNQITIGNGNKTIMNFSNPPSLSTLNFPLRTGNMRQEDTNVIRVDKSGSDIYGSRNGFPFLTVGVALSVAQPGDLILLSPGVYNEDSLLIPNNVTLTSIGDTSKLNCTTTTDKTVLTMGEFSKIENIDVDISSNTSNITITAISFTGTASVTSCVKNCNIVATNTTNDNATVYGIYCTCTGTISFTNPTVIGTNIVTSAPNAVLGIVRSALIEKGDIEFQDCNLSSVSGQGAEAIGLETTSSLATVFFKSSSVKGTDEDYIHPLGKIYINFSQTDNLSIISGNGDNLVISDNGTIIADQNLIAKGNISATGGTGYFLNISTNNITGNWSTFDFSTIKTIQSISGSFQNIQFTNATGENLNSNFIITNSITGNIGSFNNLNVSSISGASFSFGNANITNLTSSNITGTSAHIDNMIVNSFTGSIVNGQSIYTTNITGTNGTFTSLNATNITGSSIYTTSGNITNITGVTSTFTTSRAINFTGTNGTLTTLSAINLSGNTQTYNSGNITNLSSTNFTGTNGFITNLGINNITGVNANILNITTSNITGNNGFFTNLGSVNSSAVNTNNTNLSTTNFTGTNGFVTNFGTNNITGVSANFSNINVNNLSSTNFTVTNGFVTNLGTNSISGTVAIIANTISTNIVSTNFTGTNGFITNLGTNNITGVSANITNTTHTNLSTSNFTGSNGFITNLGTNNITGNNAIFSNIINNNTNVTNISVSNLTGTNGFITNLGTNNIFTTNFTGTNGFVTNFGTNNITTTNLSSTNFTGTNGFVTNLGTNNISGTVAIIANTISTNLLATNFTGTNGFITNLGVNSITTTNLSSTNLSSTNFTGTNGFITNLGTNNITGVSANITNTTHTNLSTINFTGTNGFITNLGTNNITGVNARISNISTTSITGTNAFFTTLGITNFAPNNSNITNLFTTNMTGTNGFITNLGTNNITGVYIIMSTGTFKNIVLNPSGSILGLTGGNMLISSQGNELVFEQTGDTFGTTRLRLQNRNGVNGALFENPSLDIVDFIFAPSSGQNQNVRYEHRNTSLICPANTGGEFEFGIPANPSFVSGPNTTSVVNGKFGIGVINPTGDLHVLGTSVYAGNTGAITLDPSKITSSYTVFPPSSQGITGTTMVNDGSGTLSWMATIQYAIFKDLKNPGTAGGTFTSGAWRTRTLNNIETNIPDVSLASNRFTLPAGRYVINASAPAYFCALHQTRIQNITDATTALVGQSGRTTISSGLGAGGDTMGVSVLTGTITITSPKVFELQHQCGSTRNNDGFGVAGNFGQECYSIVSIERVY